MIFAIFRAIVPLPGRTKDGCAILLQRFGAIDPDTKEFTLEEEMRVINRFVRPFCSSL